MIGIVIVAHGGLAQQYLESLEHVVGQHVGTRAVDIWPEDDRAAKQAEIEQAVDTTDTGEGVAIVTDIHGGTPANLACGASGNGERIVLCGANLPMLIKLSKSRTKPLNEAVTCALSAGRKYMKLADIPDPSDATTRS